MLKTILKVSLVSILTFTISACTQVGVPTVDPNAVGTAIAETLAAFSPTASPVITVTTSGSPTASSTVTTVATLETLSPTPTRIQSSTATAIPLLTATPAATLTPVPISPGTVQVQVSVATNCRTGPGTAYPRVGAVQVGEVAQVVGRNADGTYWIIRNLARPSDNCWLWGQYATVTGDMSGLPVFSPPVPPASATPAASFDVFYDGLESCTGTGWWVDINVENLGGLTFRSVALRIEDRDDDTVLSLRTDGFTDRSGCSESNTRDNLPPGDDRTISSPIFAYDINDRRLRATITLCSNTGQSGTCITQTVNFTP